MTTIDKIPFKTTIPILLAIIYATYNFANNQNESTSKITSQINEIKNSQEILSLQVKNGFRTINNDRKRDSATSINGQNEIKTSVKELQSLFFRGQFGGKSVSNND